MSIRPRNPSVHSLPQQRNANAQFALSFSSNKSKDVHASSIPLDCEMKALQMLAACIEARNALVMLRSAIKGAIEQQLVRANKSALRNKENQKDVDYWAAESGTVAKDQISFLDEQLTDLKLDMKILGPTTSKLECEKKIVYLRNKLMSIEKAMDHVNANLKVRLQYDDANGSLPRSEEDQSSVDTLRLPDDPLWITPWKAINNACFAFSVALSNAIMGKEAFPHLELFETYLHLKWKK